MASNTRDVPSRTPLIAVHSLTEPSKNITLMSQLTFCNNQMYIVRSVFWLYSSAFYQCFFFFVFLSSVYLPLSFMPFIQYAAFWCGVFLTLCNPSSSNHLSSNVPPRRIDSVFVHAEATFILKKHSLSASQRLCGIHSIQQSLG